MGLSPQELLLLVQGPTLGGNVDSGSPDAQGWVLTTSQHVELHMCVHVCVK